MYWGCINMNCTVKALFVAVFSLTGWFQNDVDVSASCLKQWLLLQQLQWDLTKINCFYIYYCKCKGNLSNKNVKVKT